jgi:Domain of unknown function (DUF4388)
MSFIGMLEQFSLAAILQKIEEEAKNGVLIIKQEAQWVELSFRQGQLMCIGPVRSNKTLGDRLLQAGVISQKAFQEISSTLGASLQNETLTAIALVNLEYLNKDSLYVWATQESKKVLKVLLSWTTGELYFDEGMQPPADRLLIALTVSSLVPRQTLDTPSQFAHAGAFSSVHSQKQSIFRTASSHIPDASTLPDSSQFYSTSATPSNLDSIDCSEGYAMNVVRNTDALNYPTASMSMSKRLNESLTPNHIDTAFMQPQMVLNPTDLSGLRNRNLLVQLTPEQWRLFTVADGKTTLQMACQQLVMSREQVCRVAGELVALSLVTVCLPDTWLMHDSNPFSQGLAKAGLSDSYVAQNQSARDSLPSTPIETHSQWGNGGTGATFVLGNGWVVASSPSQPLQSNELYNDSGMEYAEASGIRK